MNSVFVIAFSYDCIKFAINIYKQYLFQKWFSKHETAFTIIFKIQCTETKKRLHKGRTKSVIECNSSKSGRIKSDSKFTSERRYFILSFSSALR